MQTVAVIVAAGIGSRVGGDVPKQYRPIHGRSVLARTLEAFLRHEAVDAVVCAIHPDHRDLYAAAIAGLGAEHGRLRPPVDGGATRQASVRHALEALAALDPAPGICLVHDAARPFVGPDLIDAAVAAGQRHGAAVPGVQPTDTMKRVDDDGCVTETLDRGRLRGIQTPQAFRFETLLHAHRAARDAGLDAFTDDGGLAEWVGLVVHVFPGDPANVKVTHAGDFSEAERKLGGGGPTMITRVGTGFDVHAFADGDHVWLGGVRISHDRGVLAHSDGDVVLHALTDAVLGAIGDGDIGTHFPPSDAQWAGASSDRFLAHAAAEVRKHGGLIDHLDVTVMCERPKIGPNRMQIRERIAAIAGVPLGSVSIKATTTEELGFTGRREGLAAQAAATIRMPAAG